jgi:hypothetical protein
VKVSVSDQGYGICRRTSADIRQVLFNRPSREIGLGLAFCKLAVGARQEDHGRIETDKDRRSRSLPAIPGDGWRTSPLSSERSFPEPPPGQTAIYARQIAPSRTSLFRLRYKFERAFYTSFHRARWMKPTGSFSISSGGRSLVPSRSRRSKKPGYRSGRSGADRQRRIGHRQISAIFDTRALGCASSPWRPHPGGGLEEAAAVINGHPGVSHYRRNDAFNLWFTIAIPPDSRPGSRTVERLGSSPGGIDPPPAHPPTLQIGVSST